ncbi:MAG: hypothetical protein AB7I50_11315 [Vicinamibacterales bacterium]
MSSSLPIFLVAFALRVVAVLVLGHYRQPVLWENGVIARYLMAGCGFCMDFSLTAEPSSWQAPAYPLLLFATWSVFGEGARAYLIVSLLQAAALASMVFPVGRLTRRWIGEPAATWAMWLVAVMPLLVWYATRLHQAGLVMALHPWLLYWWVRLGDRPRSARGALVGLGSGVAALFQPILLLLAVCFGTAQMVRALATRNWRIAWALGVAAVLAAGVLTPWTVRNYEVHGRFVPIRDSFGKELWMGNNPNATGTSFAVGGETEITFAYPPKAFALKGQVPEADLMEAMRREAVDYIRAEPAAFLRRTSQKVLWFWTAAPADRVRRTEGGEAIEFRWLYLGSWATFVGLSVLGAWTTRCIPRSYWLTLALYVGVYSVLYGVTHVGQARYRGEMEFVLIPLAAAGLSALVSMAQPASRRQPRPASIGG